MTRNGVPVSAVVLAAVLGLAPAACAPEEDGQRTREITAERAEEARSQLPVEVVSALDSGNRAYRDGDYRRALRFYQRATGYDSTVAAGWFGLYMTRSALGDEEAAQVALERASALSSGREWTTPPGAPDTSNP